MAERRTMDWTAGPHEATITGSLTSDDVVIALHTMWGLTPAFQSLCESLALDGHMVIAPNLYRPSEGPPARSDGRVDPAAQFQRFSDVRAVWDVRHLIDRLPEMLNRKAPIRSVAVVGLCLGGRIAHMLGAVGSGISRVANLYGLLSFPRTETKPITPFDVSGLMSSSFLGVFAAEDPLIPLTDVRQVEARMQVDSHVRSSVIVVPGVSHDFVSEDSPNYDAKRATEAIAALRVFLRAD